MIGYSNIQEYSVNITDEKEKVIINKLQLKMDRMLGYRTDKMHFEQQSDTAKSKL